jgi:hypothetical protein
MGMDLVETGFMILSGERHVISAGRRHLVYGHIAANAAYSKATSVGIAYI